MAAQPAASNRPPQSDPAPVPRAPRSAPGDVSRSHPPGAGPGAPWQIIPTRVHGMLDYLLGLLLLVAPWLLGFAHNGAETWVPVVLGVMALLYSFCTNYELGVVRLLPMPLHLGLDFFSGLLLAVSPWLFGFSDVVWAPHFVLGLLEVGAALLTRPHPSFAGGHNAAARSPR